MNDNAIKNYATWARRELMSEVEKRCAWWGIAQKGAPSANADVIDGRVLSQQERAQRAELLRMMAEDGYASLVERAAYTWFNRLLAIRFMEVNGRLPSHVRVLSASDGTFSPQCLREAMDLPLDALDAAEVASLVQEGDDEALFRVIFLAQCDELAKCMPAVFEGVGSAMELLLPMGLLRAEGIVGRLVTEIPEEDWREGVEIVGWMYQYYVSERKDEVFASFKKRKKAERDAIAPATQLFTPHWIVRYLTENSLGRLWMLNNPQSGLVDKMPYFIKPDEEHETEFRRIASPEVITVVDPACGSGHILVYAFDLLLEMYRESGYRDRDAAKSIIQNNLTGLEIDRRAAAMASFALTMKACEVDGRFLRRGVTPRITVLERVEFTDEELDHLPNLTSNKALLDAVTHLDECGSLLQVTSSDLNDIERDLASLAKGASLFAGAAEAKLVRLRTELEPLAARYDVVVANPPYMGVSNIRPWMASWIKKCYPHAKKDLFACFIIRNSEFGLSHAQLGYVTPYTWMFISTYERLRRFVIENNTITSLIQLEYNAFPVAMVPVCTFTLQKGHLTHYVGSYIRLSDFKGADQQAPRALEALANPDCGWFYKCECNRFSRIPGIPIAYWISLTLASSFAFKPLSFYGQTRQGFATGDNDGFLRCWYEVPFSEISFESNSIEDFHSANKTYAPCNKGGEFRKWFGNRLIVCRFNHTAYETLSKQGNHLPSREYYFRSGLTWSALGSSYLSMRFAEKGFLFETKGSMFFSNTERKCTQYYLLGIMNSSVAMSILKVLCPTIDFHEGPVSKVPVVCDESRKDMICAIVSENIKISNSDWDAVEKSWSFRRHSMV